MLNARPIDNKFWVSGGWENVERDIKWLKEHNIRAVLDLQYTLDDNPNLPIFVKNRLADEGIEYHSILMWDGEWNYSVHAIFLEGENKLELWDTTFTGKKDRILVKCGAGISRSVSQYLNYICFRDKVSFADALAEFSRAEYKWASMYAETNFWPGSPDWCFRSLLARKHSRNGSIFGEVVRDG